MLRFLSVALVVVLLALVGYNVRQVSLLRREVAALKAGKKIASPESSGPLSLITKARQHADQAKKDIHDGNLERAKAELEKSLHLMQQAYQDSSTQSTETVGKVRRSLTDLRAMIERLRQKSDNEQDKGG